MNDIIFDLLYKAEQREIVAKVRQKEMLNRNLSVAESEYPSSRRGIRRVWQMLISRSGRE